MTWWQKLFYGFNTTSDEKKREPLDPELGYNDSTGELDSPKYLDTLESQGFYYNKERSWWQRVWTTWTPESKYPNLKEIWEVRQFDVVDKKWDYLILDPTRLGGLGGGGSSGFIWKEEIGKKE